MAFKIVSSLGEHCRCTRETLAAAREAQDRGIIEDADSCLVYSDEHIIIVSAITPSRAMEIRRRATDKTIIALNDEGKLIHLDPELKPVLEQILAVFKKVNRGASDLEPSKIII